MAPEQRGPDSGRCMTSGRGPGRPPAEDGFIVQRDDDGNIISVQVAQEPNWDRLAVSVDERIKSHRLATGKKLKTKDAVKAELLAAIKRNETWPEDRRPDSWKPFGVYRVDELLPTAYTEVRKRLAKQKKNEGS